MEAKRINIDRLYRDKEMQLEPLPFGAWDALSTKLHAPQSNIEQIRQSDKPTATGSSLHVVIITSLIACSVLLYYYFHHSAISSVPNEVATPALPYVSKTNSLNLTQPKATISSNPTLKDNKINSGTSNQKQALVEQSSSEEKSPATLKTITEKANPADSFVKDTLHQPVPKAKATAPNKVPHQTETGLNEQPIKHELNKNSADPLPQAKTNTTNLGKPSEAILNEHKDTIAKKSYPNSSQNPPLKDNRQHPKPLIPKEKDAEQINANPHELASAEKTEPQQPRNQEIKPEKKAFIKPKPKGNTLKSTIEEELNQNTDQFSEISLLKTKDNSVLPSTIFSPIMLLQSAKISSFKNIYFDNKLKDSNARKHLAIFKNLDGGIKAGYEVGTGANADNKSVFAGFLQYKITNKLSFAIQPGIKMSNGVGYETSNANYYQLTGTNVTTFFDSMLNTAVVYQHFDSLYVIRNATKSNNVQLELMILAKYKLNNHFGFSAGVGFNKGALPFATETKNNIGNFYQTDTFYYQPGTVLVIDTSNSFFHTSQNLSQFNSFNGLNQASNPLRINYFASVEYWYKHWLIELAITQQLTNLSGLNDKNLQNSYQQPYIRIMTGWRFGK